MGGRTAIGKGTDNNIARKGMVQVSESEYYANEQARLEEFAQYIRGCGITLYEIAKGTRIKYDTLLRALRKKVIRPDTEARIRYYITRKQNEETKNQSESC